MTRISDGTNVRNRHHRIRREVFNVNQLGLWPNRRRNGRCIRRINVREARTRHAPAPCQTAGTFHRTHCPNTPRDRPTFIIVQSADHRGHSGAKTVRRTPALKRAQVFFECVARRVRQPHIFVPLVLPNRFLLIRGGEVDRYIDRASERISFLPIIDGASRKALLGVWGIDSRIANCKEKGSRKYATALLKPLARSYAYEVGVNQMTPKHSPNPPATSRPTCYAQRRHAPRPALANRPAARSSSRAKDWASEEVVVIPNLRIIVCCRVVDPSQSARHARAEVDSNRPKKSLPDPPSVSGMP